MDSPTKIKLSTPKKRKRQEGSATERAMAYFEPIDNLLSPSSSKTHKCKLCAEYYNGNREHNLVVHLSKKHVCAQ